MVYRVLVIDDSDPDLLYTQIMLERCGAPFLVQTCDSARAALQDLAQGVTSADLILLDINMPGMSGFEFLDAYQRLGGVRLAPAVVVMLTSSPDPLDRERALAYAAVRGYVTKPIDLPSAAALLQYLPG